jgi:Fe-S-cluster containining protein
MDPLFDNYRNLRKKVDGFLRGAIKAHGGDMVCRKGCASCCRHLTLFPVEALHIRLSLDGLEPEQQRKIQERALLLSDSPDGECPLLQGGECLLYPERPLICRTHGFPVFMATGAGYSVDHCPLNFTSGGAPGKAHTLDIDVMNTALVTINRLFMKSWSRPESFPDRILLAQVLLLNIKCNDSVWPCFSGKKALL